MRRLLGGLSLLALLASSAARTATAQPVPGTPADAIALLKWCWENRDMARYHELFADNFQYYYDVGNPAGAPYQTTPWSRSDELVSGSNLFLGGGTKSPASSITITFTDGPTLIPNPGGVGYPWHQQLVAQWTLDITCIDGSTLHGGGASKWFVVRGDSAAIPQELKDRGFTADPGRWYIERWLEQESNAPIVRAPSVASGTPFNPVTILVTAQDPDGDPINSLSASESGFSGNFYPGAGNTTGTFNWTPYPTDVGPHGVTFAAVNSLTGVATTTINVVSANRPPVPALVVTPPGGAVPLSVTADASGSSDPDGRIVSYQFTFGDGTAVGPQSSPTATHMYSAVGTWPLILTVTDDLGATASIGANVAVTGVAVASVSVAPATATIAPGATVKLTATPKDASGNALTGRSITWASDNTAVATVNSSGLVSGVAVGSANITATCEGKSASSVITVFVIPVASVSVMPVSVSIAVGATRQVTATPMDASGNVLTGRTITWASDNAAAVTVNSSGVVRGVAAGLANITATCEGKSASSAITVTAAPVASVSLSPASADIAPGATVQLSATLKDASGKVLAGRTITWASDNTAAATIDSSGLVTGVTDGLANITATCEGKSGSSAITVARAASVVVTPATASVTVGATQQLIATPKDAGGNALTGRTITWASDNTAAATVSSSGLVTGVALGSANITATCEGQNASSAISIIVPPVASVSVTPVAVSVAVAATQQLTATPKDASGNALTGRTISWASDNTAAATVGSGGLVTGVAAGSANVTATCEGRSGSSVITVWVSVPPTDAIALLKSCWENRDIAHYHELFADNYQYIDEVINPYSATSQAMVWTRSDELVSGSNLFLGGGTKAPASSVTLTFTDGPTLLSNSGSPGYPWHQQLVAQWTLDITCTDGSTLHGGGASKWYVVRGDSAAIPQELMDRGFSPNPGRWYIERWLEEQNTAPIVTAPSVASGTPFSPVTVHVTAQDPDGDPIASLGATESGFNANFYPGADNTTGTFSWVPYPTDIGPHGVTFRAANSLTGVATTTINVVGANRPPIPALVVTPPAGAEPLSVTADASGSTDPDGRIVSYRFSFGDGTAAGPQPIPTASHTYSAVGTWPLTLTVTDDLGATASISASVTVTGSPVASVSVSPATATIGTGATQQLTATLKDASGNALGGRSITWASDNTAAATVNSSGLVAGVAAGSANITAACEGKSGSSAITVIVIPVASVSVTPASASVAVGATQQLTATPKDAGGTVLTGRTMTWASDNTAATVSSSGLVNGVTIGSANITATCEGQSGSSAITVTTADPVSSLPNLVGNPSFEADTSGWQTFAGSLIERVPGGYDGLYALQMTGTASLAWGFGVNDHPDWIHRTTVAGRRYRLTAHVRSAANRGLARIRVREYLLATGALLGQISSFGTTLTPAWQTLVVDYTNLSAGSSLDFQVKETPLVANEVFLTDAISIKDITGVPGLAVAQGEIESGPNDPQPNDAVLSFRAAVYPSPVQTSAVLSFATTRTGALRVDLLDLAGRAVRHLDDESDAPAGVHMLTIDGIRDDGQRMRPGMYFYRIVANEGRLTGRFVMLK